MIKRTLQVNILIAFTTLLVITVLIIVGYTYQQNSTAVLNLSSSLIAQVTDNVIERTTNHLAPAADLARASANIPGIEQVEITDNEAVDAYGMEILELYPQLSGFFIGDETGNFLFTKREADGSISTQQIDRGLNEPQRTWTYRTADGAIREVETTTELTYDPRERPWYQGAVSNRTQYWTDIYIFFTDQKPGITAAYPVTNAAGEIDSVIGIDVTLDELSAFLETQQIGENGIAFILNDRSELVAYPGIELAVAEGDSFRPIQISELALPWLEAAYAQFLTDGPGQFVVEVENERYISSFTPLTGSFGRDWLIGLVVPEDDFIGSIKRTNQITLIISFGILVLSIASAVYLSRSISQPIVELTAETRKIREFELDNEINIQSPIQEVRILSEAIEGMKTGLSAFKKYVPDELVRQLIQTGEDARLGGQRRECTVVFTDIVGFTAITEGSDPVLLMDQLSYYLGELVNIVSSNRGSLDKFTGDGLLAFWGAPLPSETHARDACLAALRCRDKVTELNAAWQLNGRHLFPTRMSVSTGETLVGNMGSPDRMNYTILGDSVNLGSRLQSANDVYGVDIVVSHNTFLQTADAFHFRPLDIVTVRGKREYVLIYELVGERGHTDGTLVTMCAAFQEGFDLYIAQQWPEAESIFADLAELFPDDAVNTLYRDRCRRLIQHPPGPDWNPIVPLESV